MSIEKRIATLEAVKHNKNSALPLLDFKWAGPQLTVLAFRIEGKEVIERLPGESDEAYKARSLDICQKSNRGRQLPVLQTNEAFLIKNLGV